MSSCDVGDDGLDEDSVEETASDTGEVAGVAPLERVAMIVASVNQTLQVITGKKANLWNPDVRDTGN